MTDGPFSVFLVPVAPGLTAPYTEADHDESVDPPAAPGAAPGAWSRMVARFRAMLAEAERERRGAGQGGAERRGGLWRAILRRIAETIAEQRLLWRLRHERHARLAHPLALSPVEAVDAMRAHCAADYTKHRRWLVIDGAITAVTGPLFFFIPGPNIVSWYFAFRAVGHYFSMRGARQGRDVVVWTPEPSAELSDITAALALDRPARVERLARISRALGLDHLGTFVERVARVRE